MDLWLLYCSKGFHTSDYLELVHKCESLHCIFLIIIKKVIRLQIMLEITGKHEGIIFSGELGPQYNGTCFPGTKLFQMLTINTIFSNYSFKLLIL